MNKPRDFDAATQPQVNAADPRHASWVSASAGSGKTKVLTDRAVRLLLSGTPPQRILCLTFTAAAASNMQNRLFERLGKWSMLPGKDLYDELLDLGERPDSLNQERLRQARTLFARALEAPGGIRIQTIHAFAGGILRLFPLEAGVSPQFKSLDDRSARNLRNDVLNTVSAASPAVFGRLAEYINFASLQGLVEEIAGSRPAFAQTLADEDAYRLFGLDPALPSLESLIKSVFTEQDTALISILIKHLGRRPGRDKQAKQKLEKLNLASPSRADYDILAGTFLYGIQAASPFEPKINAFPTKAARAELGPLALELDVYMYRVSKIREPVMAADAAAKTIALHRFAEEFLSCYEQRKRRESSLDFDDLIIKTLELLNNPATARWVFHKLDGGIDHILIDEAQDVSRRQWRIITAVAEESASARARTGTLFAVGDEKQSIYGFQGAAPEMFEEMRRHFRSRSSAAGRQFTEEDLTFSFRSSPAILNVVDKIFEKRTEPGFGGMAAHRAYRSSLPGRVDIWPVIEPPEETKSPDWYGTELIPKATQATKTLAGYLAREIRRMADPAAAERIPSGGGSRPVRNGDFLILLRRRNDLFHLIISELKSIGLPVAGTDRMRLSDSLAVQDLRALLSFLATPADDLSLAAALRSPIFQISEEELFSIACPRNDTLWHALLDSESQHGRTVAVIRDLLAQATRMKPYELIEYLLTVHGARQLLTARLGREIAEPLDAFLHQAIAYDENEASSLTGFLEWSDNDSEIKRRLDQASDEIRVMTVHGAKGLEAPIVILPDTCNMRLRLNREHLLFTEDGVPLWNVPEKERPQLLETAAAAARRQVENEHLRLLYVALTRAENWLIVAGAGKAGDTSWHRLIENGTFACRPLTTKSPGLPKNQRPFTYFLRHSFAEWPAAAPAGVTGQKTLPELPGWVREAVPEPVQSMPVSPSALGGDDPERAENAGDGRRRGNALQRGNMIHHLLERLPGCAQTDRKESARTILRCKRHVFDETLFHEVYAEAIRILDDPKLGFLFGGLSFPEVGITANLAGLGGARIQGCIDRLVVAPDRVLAVDFKSNFNVPKQASEVPEHILRQLGAYQEALEQLYPRRLVRTSVLWTRTG